MRLKNAERTKIFNYGQPVASHLLKKVLSMET